MHYRMGIPFMANHHDALSNTTAEWTAECSGDILFKTLSNFLSTFSLCLLLHLPSPKPHYNPASAPENNHLPIRPSARAHSPKSTPGQHNIPSPEQRTCRRDTSRSSRLAPIQLSHTSIPVCQSDDTGREGRGTHVADDEMATRQQDRVRDVVETDDARGVDRQWRRWRRRGWRRR